ncbi:MAG: 1-(5-phosphoribosyl)-5-[Clostridia bacterium]|nr:1-(5-phosphoribosyl)-5-[(5-phosphoribosylamino)methylideneamino]imidazole-4-carboxamide isomerase [Clostridia bacterium]
MEIFPAIDMIDGQVVRLVKGDYAQKQVYGADPAAVARSFFEQGARNLHLVDLDAARTGIVQNKAQIAAIAKTGLFVEVGGGIRSCERIEEYLALGVQRVILGTVAAKDPDFVSDMVRRFGSAIAVSVDARDGMVAVSGWQETTALESFAFCRDMADRGVETVIYTDIGRDGLLGGANIAAYKSLNRIQGLNIIASGGVSFESDITALRDLGVYGAIVGKALYENKLSLPRVLSLAQGGSAS